MKNGKKTSDDKPEKKDGEDVLLESYEVESDTVKTRVSIVEKGYMPFYKLTIPEVDVATKVLLDDIKERLIGAIDMNISEVFDAKLMNELKNEFKNDAGRLLMEELPDLDPMVKDSFILSLVHELLGLGDVEYLLDDNRLEEVVVNSVKEPIRVYHKKYGWLKTNITLSSEAEILNYSNTIARRVGREISTLNPLLDAHLISGDRVNATINPISTKGHTITIRKFSRDPWTATDFAKNKTVNTEILALIWLVIQYEMNIIISGGTGSGKTSFLNICMPFIPPNHRIISIEDTRELQLPQFLYWCPLTTREPNPEGKGEVTMLDLLINSLRMRPDRIIMGEIRKQREAEVLFEAMHTGHSVYSTLHADSCAQTINRLTNPPICIPSSMLDAVHLNIVMFRDRRLGLRRVFEVGEFTPAILGNMDEMKFRASILYRWDPRTDEIRSTTEDVALYEKIGVHTGFSVEEVKSEIKAKMSVLEWMIKNNIRQVEDVGKVMNRYYLDTETVIELAENDKSPKELLETSKEP
ncbi:MAG: CpaF family protein [Candidatus Altiarchaeota archaeon]|nr:CpaF family protein [Candidatus Altiarchaeota archaeon]